MWLLDCEQSLIFFKVAGVTDTHRKQVTKIISELESSYLFPRRSPCNEIIVHHFNCRILGVTKRIVSRTVHEYENKFKRVPKLRYTVKKSSYGNNSKTKTEEFF